MRPYFLWLSFCCLGLVYGAVLSLSSFSHCIVNRQTLPPSSTLNFTSTSALFPAVLHSLSSSSSSTPFVLWSASYCKSLSNSPWTFFLVSFGLVPVLALHCIQSRLLHIDQTTIECIAALATTAKLEIIRGQDDINRERDEIREGNRRIAVSVRSGAGRGGGGDAERVQSVQSVDFMSSALRKDWSLIHRHEPLYRLLAPDPFWRLLDCRHKIIGRTERES